jgi:HTH-type transcriptional regulator, sugar sensing transcriptional regulator
MMFDEKILSAMQKLGLTRYGAKTYIVIATFSPISASEIAKEASIQRTKIYDVLNKLEEDEWINVEHGRPKLFTARDPRNIIDQKQSALLNEIDSLSSTLSLMYDQQIKKEMPNVWLINGKDNIIAKSVDMVSKAKKSVTMMGDLYFPEEVKSLRSIILNAKQNRIRFRIISRDIVKTSEGEINLVKSFADVNPEMVISMKPPIKYVTVDEKEILVIFPKINEDILNLDKVVALWIPNPVVASSMVDMFNMRWNEHYKN